ncbi:hypothetical protein TeGR_g9381, partial [Tetraparma gracilis]
YRVTPEIHTGANRGKQAISHVTPLLHDKTSSTTLFRVKILTGRTHQIRVHLSNLGCPVAGDDVYGSAKPGNRLMLHAHRLEIDDPEGGGAGAGEAGRRVVQGPLPEDFCKAIKVMPGGAEMLEQLAGDSSSA